MRRVWNTPTGEYSRLYADIARQSHCLIAGATGSGKSVVINGIIHSLLFKAPCDVGFILIDPKRVELATYSDLPHTIAHAKGFNPESWKKALYHADSIMDCRYSEMERKRQKMYHGSDIYVVIDEYATIAKAGGIECYKAILRLTSEGRAAKVHVIMATQVPKADIIRTEIRENFTARLCLRCNTKAQSRVLMDVSGCECLPLYGYGYYITPRGKELYRLPYTQESDIDRLVTYWTGKQGRGRIAIFG